MSLTDVFEIATDIFKFRLSTGSKALETIRVSAVVEVKEHCGKNLNNLLPLSVSVERLDSGLARDDAILICSHHFCVFSVCLGAGFSWFSPKYFVQKTLSPKNFKQKKFLDPPL